MACCGGRNINNFGGCGGQVSPINEATIHQIITDVCMKKFRRNCMQDVYGKCGGTADPGCCPNPPPCVPCCPSRKPRLSLRCQDPCRPLIAPPTFCPTLCCPQPGCCTIPSCGNPCKPKDCDDCVDPCCPSPVVVVRPIRNPCCPVPRVKSECCPDPCQNSFNPDCISVQSGCPCPPKNPCCPCPPSNSCCPISRPKGCYKLNCPCPCNYIYPSDCCSPCCGPLPCCQPVCREPFCPKFCYAECYRPKPRPNCAPRCYPLPPCKPCCPYPCCKQIPWYPTSKDPSTCCPRRCCVKPIVTAPSKACYKPCLPCCEPCGACAPCPTKNPIQIVGSCPKPCCPPHFVC